MNKYIKRNELIAYTAFAVGFILTAVLIDWQSATVDNVFAPLRLLGDGIRDIGNNAGAYIVYILICSSPLIYPAMQILKSKKIERHYLAWLALSVFMFVALYFAINPHKLQFAVTSQDFPIEAAKYYQDVTLLGLFMTFVAILVLCLILEFNFRQKKNETKIFAYAKALFILLIIAALANIFFFGVMEIKTQITQITENQIFAVNDAVNILMTLLIFILKFVPTFFSVVLFILSKAFIEDMKHDMFAVANIEKLNRIVKVCLINIYTALGSIIVVNLLNFMLSGHLLNVLYAVAIPFTMIIAACLIIIFAKILIKSIKINEENKLVI